MDRNITCCCTSVYLTSQCKVPREQMNTHLFSNNNLSERGLLKLINSSTVEKRNLLQSLKEGEKKKKHIFDYRHRFEESEIVEHLVFGEAARDELKVMADFWMQAKDEERGPSEIHTAVWEITGAQTVDKHTGNYSLTKHTSHHQHETTQSENIPSSLTNLICHQPQPNCCFFPFFFFSLHTPEGPADLQ